MLEKYLSSHSHSAFCSNVSAFCTKTAKEIFINTTKTLNKFSSVNSKARLQIMFTSLFYVKTLEGESFRIFLNPREPNSKVICKKIAEQLPFPINKVICEGKDLSLLNDIPSGFGSFLSKITILVF